MSFQTQNSLCQYFNAKRDERQKFNHNYGNLFFLFKFVNNKPTTTSACNDEKTHHDKLYYANVFGMKLYCDQVV